MTRPGGEGCPSVGHKRLDAARVRVELRELDVRCSCGWGATIALDSPDGYGARLFNAHRAQVDIAAERQWASLPHEDQRAAILGELDYLDQRDSR